MQVCQHSQKNEESPGDCKNPANNAPAAPKQQANPEKHRQEGNAKGIFSVEIPVGAHHRNLID